MGLPRTDWCNFQLACEEMWFGLPMSLLFLQSSPGWELLRVFRVITASSSVFAEPSANHSHKQDQHWFAPLTCLTYPAFRSFLKSQDSWKDRSYRRNACDGGNASCHFPLAWKVLPPTEKKNPKAHCHLHFWKEIDSCLFCTATVRSMCMLFIPSLPISVTLSVILNVILFQCKQLGAQ